MAFTACRVAMRLGRVANRTTAGSALATRGWASVGDGTVVIQEAGLRDNDLPVSGNLLRLLRDAGKHSQEDLVKRLGASLQDSTGDDLNSPKVREEIEGTLALISEVLNLGTALAEDGVPVYRDLSEADLAALLSLREALNERFSGPNEVTVNTAAPGQLPWEVLEVEEDKGAVWWGADLTEGRAGVAPWRSSALSHATKREMARLHADDPERHSIAELAREFGVREQRVAAILALQELEGAALKNKSAEETKALLREIDERDSAALAPVEGTSGSGEARVTVLPSFPNYHEADLAAFAARLEAQTGKKLEDITDDDLTPEVARAAVSLESQEEIEERLAASEEARLVGEFRQRLDYNLGRTGGTLRRTGHRARFVPRPKEGWDLLVKPLRDETGKEPYVAKGDGEARPITEDEELLLGRQTPKPRRRIL